MLKWIQGNISAVTGIAEPVYGAEYIHTVSDRLKGKQPFRSTTLEDFNWQDPDHTNVETVTFYFSDLKTGMTGFAQIIHSNIVGMHTAAQFTFRICDSKNPEQLNLWTSTKLENFRVEGPNFYADGISIELSEDNTEYHIDSNVCERSKIDLHIKRITSGAKAGEDPSTYYGDKIDEPWGSMRHVFWPRNSCYGTIDIKLVVEQSDEEEEDEAVVAEEPETESESESDSESDSDSDEDEDEEEEVVYEDRNITFKKDAPAFSMFVMAMQGMKPHHAARAWNFVYVHTEKNTALVMEYITPKSYGNTKVSVGIVTSDTEVLTLSVDNDYQHLNAEVDEVGWNVPKDIKVELNGIGINVTDEQIENEKLEAKDMVTAVITAPLKNRVERVDVMGEVPAFVKNIVSGIAGTKPYIYQYSNDEFTLQVNDGPATKGLGWAEVSFISEADAVNEEAYNES